MHFFGEVLYKGRQTYFDRWVPYLSFVFNRNGFSKNKKVK